MKQKFFRILSIVMILSLSFGLPGLQLKVQAAGTISLAALDTAYTQNFDTLASTGTSSALPEGWDFSESGTNANTTYAAGTGSATAGDTYSFGAASSTERAFGELQSSSLVPTFGASFTNNTGVTVTQLVMAYTGEMWRAGVNNRGAADRIDFQLSTDATSLTTGAWTDYDALDFSSPALNATQGALDGNASGNRAAVSFTISNLAIANGATFWIRWTDFNISSSDDGLAVDDFLLTPRVGDAAPAVSSTTPANGAVNVLPTANLTITFSEEVTVADPWFTISCSSSGDHNANVTGGPTTFTLDPTTNFGVTDNCTVTVLAAKVTDNDANDPPDTMAADYTWSFSVEAPSTCGGPKTYIYEVQGSGATSPITNTVVTIEGVVTGDFQGNTNLSGFTVQEPAGDDNPATSDGVFVFAPGSQDVSVGDVVRLVGTVQEYNGMTELGNVTNLRQCGTGSVAPTPVTFPEVANNDLEQVEGMLVTFPIDLTIDQNYFLGRYGQLTLSSGGRLYNPTNGNGLGESVEGNARRLIVLDDGKSAQNPSPIPYIGQDSTNRAGDRISGLTGIIDYGPINSSSPAAYDYRIQPTEPVTITRVNARSVVPNLVITPGKSMNLKVASFNVLNYFNGDGQGGGFPTSRGANTQLEFNRQREKIIEALAAINADVVGLMEIENDGAGQYSAIQDLVNGLNTKMGAGTYTFITEPTPGTDEIKVAMLYKPGRVIPYGSPHNYQVTANPSYNPLFDRPPLAQTFSEVTSGGLFSVVVNHFKSKGSCPDSGPDVDLGQGCWNAKRTAQAAALLVIVNGLKGIDPDVVVVGDLNSYGQEDPIQTLVDGGLVNELASRVAPAERYTYIFDGQSGYLDQGLVTGKMDGQVVGVTIWHINADEPAVIDYNTEFKPQDLYTKTPYRSSDHDPVILAFSLKPPSAITLETLEATARPGVIRLEWTTGLETGLVGFNIYRSTSPSGPREQINSSLLPGGGGDGSYAYEDTTVIAGTRYYYWVEAVDDIDKTSEFGPADALALWGVYLPLVHGQP